MVEHIDTLDSLNRHAPLKEKLVSAHMTIKKSLPFIARIAIALETLKQLAGEKLDRDCVTALSDNMEEVEKIQQYFKENIYI